MNVLRNLKIIKEFNYFNKKAFTTGGAILGSVFCLNDHYENIKDIDKIENKKKLEDKLLKKKIMHISLFMVKNYLNWKI